MRNITLLFLALLGLFSSCKKGQAIPYTQALLDTTHFLQTVTYKVINTQPSPYDLIHNMPLSDSMTYTLNRMVGAPDYLANAIEMNFSFSPDSGFFFQCGTLLLVYYTAIPDFTFDFQEGKVYEHTNDFSQTNSSLLVAMHDNFTSGDFYFTDSIPPDAYDPLVNAPDRFTYCKILITKKYILNTQPYQIKMMDGIISGYEVLSYGRNDHTKYLQRRDFSLSFTSFKYGYQ